MARVEYVWFDLWSVPQADPEQQKKAIQSIFSYVHDASQSVWGQSAYNWQAVLRAGDDPSCGGNSSRGITSADSECAHAMLEIWSGQAENKRKYSKPVSYTHLTLPTSDLV